MSKRKPTPMPTEAVHPLEPFSQPGWVGGLALHAALGVLVALCMLPLIVVALVIIL